MPQGAGGLSSETHTVILALATLQLPPSNKLQAQDALERYDSTRSHTLIQSCLNDAPRPQVLCDAAKGPPLAMHKPGGQIDSTTGVYAAYACLIQEGYIMHQMNLTCHWSD